MFQQLERASVSSPDIQFVVMSGVLRVIGRVAGVMWWDGGTLC